MKKLAIILVCILAGFTLFTGCTSQKGGDNQESDVNNSMELKVSDGADGAKEPISSDSLPDGFTYSPKAPDNSGGIVVTPKE